MQMMFFYLSHKVQGLKCQFNYGVITVFVIEHIVIVIVIQANIFDC